MLREGRVYKPNQLNKLDYFQVTVAIGCCTDPGWTCSPVVEGNYRAECNSGRKVSSPIEFWSSFMCSVLLLPCYCERLNPKHFNNLQYTLATMGVWEKPGLKFRYIRAGLAYVSNACKSVRTRWALSQEVEIRAIPFLVWEREHSQGHGAAFDFWWLSKFMDFWSLGRHCSLMVSILPTGSGQLGQRCWSCFLNKVSLHPTSSYSMCFSLVSAALYPSVLSESQVSWTWPLLSLPTLTYQHFCSLSHHHGFSNPGLLSREFSTWGLIYFSTRTQCRKVHHLGMCY